MAWIIYRHHKGNHYLGLGAARSSESLAAQEIYLCLYENDIAQTWSRPHAMFHERLPSGAPRFEPIARMRNPSSGTRYALEALDGTVVCDLNTLYFREGLMGVASLATTSASGREGDASLLLKATMAWLRFQHENLQFLLFSQVEPRLYEACGFRVLPAHQQHFKPALAMTTDRAPLAPDDQPFVERYF